MGKVTCTPVVTSSEQLEEVAAAYAEAEAFAFDVETVGEYRGDPRRNKVTWLSLATRGRTDVIPMGHPHGELVRLEAVFTPKGQEWWDSRTEEQKEKYPTIESAPKKYKSNSDAKANRVWTPAPPQLKRHDVFAALKCIFLSDAIKVGHNVKFDLCTVAKYLGEIPAAPYFDTLVAQFLLDHRLRGRLGLGQSAEREFRFSYDKTTGKEVEANPFSEVARYSYLDAKYTWLLYLVLGPQLEDERLDKLMRLEMDVLEALCSMESKGTMLDLEALRGLDFELAGDEHTPGRLEKAMAACYAAAGTPFNIGSVQQKAALLYTPKDEVIEKFGVAGQGLKPRKATNSGNPSVAAEALEPYRQRNKLVGALLEHADLSKLHSTYIRPYLDPKNLVHGRVHTDFVQTGAETGRFSSRHPNMQNIPVPTTELGKKIRGLFVAPAGHKLVVADYSQVEPRIIASFSGDKVMTQTYLDGGDVYQAVADVLGVSRAMGKRLVLSMAYGVGPDTFAERVNAEVRETGKGELITSRDAKELITEQENKFRSIGRYKEQVIKECKRRTPHQVLTLLGRRRFIQGIYASDFSVRGRAERQAFNTVIQGSAADINKLALVRSHRLLPASCPMILTVHDEIVVEAPEDEADAATAALREAMEIEGLLRVPLVADVKVVDRWSEAK